MDYTAIQPWVLTAVAGGIGGLAYSYYYKLLGAATYLQALYHVGAGAVAGILVVVVGALGPPVDKGTFLLLAGIGYGGTDVIDSFVQKLRTASPATNPTPPAAGPPAP